MTLKVQMIKRWELTQTQKGVQQCATAKILTPYYKLYDEMKMVSIVQETVDGFLQRNKTL